MSGAENLGNYLLQQLKEATVGSYPEDIYPVSDAWKSFSRCKWARYIQAWLPHLIKDSPNWSDATAISLVASVLSRNYMDSQNAIELRRRQIFIAQNSNEFVAVLILGLAELANDFRRLGDDKESKKCISDACDILALESLTKVRLKILQRLSGAAFSHGHETVSIPTTISIEKYSSRIYGELSIETAFALVDKADSFWDIGDYGNTEPCYVKALHIFLMRYPDGCPELTAVLDKLVTVYTQCDAKKLAEIKHKYARFLFVAASPINPD
jgi:hypothetical protein